MFVITYAVAVARSKIPTGGFTLQRSLLKGCWNRTNGKRYCLLCGGVPEKIRRDYMKTRGGGVLGFFGVFFEQIKVLSSK